jgi:hypothetical protein
MPDGPDVPHPRLSAIHQPSIKPITFSELDRPPRTIFYAGYSVSHPVRLYSLSLILVQYRNWIITIACISWVHQYVPGIRFVMMTYTSRFLLIRSTSIYRDKMHLSSQKWHERTKEEHCGIYMREQKVLDGFET